MSMDAIVVRTELENGGSKKYGSGFYVSRNHILTACHNLKRSNASISKEEKICITVFFPNGNTDKREAFVISYYDNEFLDCAILFDPLSVDYFCFKYAKYVYGKEVVVKGIVADRSYDIRYGKLEGVSYNIQASELCKIRITGIDIKPGMSGAPVMEKVESNRLLGYVVQRDKENYREAYYIPLESIMNLDIFSYIEFIQQSYEIESNKIASIAHFMDHYVYEVNLQYSEKKLIMLEMEKAFLYLMAISDVVYVPAVSYFEMPYCRSLISLFKESFPDQKITLIGDGKDIYSFLDLRLLEYEKSSKQSNIYKQAKNSIRQLPPYKSVETNTTDFLIQNWSSSFLDISGNPKSIFSLKYLRDSWEIRLDNIEDYLNGRAFVGSNIGNILYSKINHKNKVSIVSSINEVFFNRFISTLKCNYFCNLYYLRFGGPTLNRFKIEYDYVAMPFVRIGFYNYWIKNRSYQNYIRLIQEENLMKEIGNLRNILVSIR